MKSVPQLIEKRPGMAWIIFTVTIVAVFLIGLLVSSVIERRAEAVFVNVPKNMISQYEPRNRIWGANYPKEFYSYYLTADTTFSSKHGGNNKTDLLEEVPRLIILFAGSSSSIENNKGRGHFYAIQDVRNSLHTGAPVNDNDGPQPTSCWTCKSPDVPRLMHEEGVPEFYTGKWSRLGTEVVNFIGCADCHDSKTMNLRISRPALIEAFSRQGKDITNASPQEMRSLVCAQCHVEYYLDKKKVEGAAYVTFPWDKGMSAEAVESYYDDYKHTDWIHGISKAQMIKASHPHYEIYAMGIHAERGVSCADCHMPYKNEGGQKFTDHHIQSPLNNVANSCQICHREETARLIQDVYDRQEKTLENRNKLEESLVRAHMEAKKAWDLGANEAEMKDILLGIRKAQWLWNYSGGNGASFHAPIEISRLISRSTDMVGETRVKLARLLARKGFNQEVPYPDISTKAKAQQFIGLDMKKLQDKKEAFRKNILPIWVEAANKRNNQAINQ